MMNKLALYVFPLGVVVGGPFLPLAIILYWVSNNIWTFGQQHYVFGKIEQEEEAKKAEALERRNANAPAPGKKPNKPRRVAKDPAPDVSGTAAAAKTAKEITEPEIAEEADPGTSETAAPKGSNNDASNETPGATPRPGARPKKRKR
jgi:YidC/Oxa1 family membrane protein insertase